MTVHRKIVYVVINFKINTVPVRYGRFPSTSTADRVMMPTGGRKSRKTTKKKNSDRKWKKQKTDKIRKLKRDRKHFC